MYNEQYQVSQRNYTPVNVDSIPRASSFIIPAPYLTSDSQVNSSQSLIIQKIEALFPILEEMAGQNDFRANQVINKLLALRQGLDSVYGDFENDLEGAENQNGELRSKIQGIDTRPKVVYVEDTETIRRL